MHWLWLGLLSLMVLFLFLFISLSLSLSGIWLLLLVVTLKWWPVRFLVLFFLSLVLVCYLQSHRCMLTDCDVAIATLVVFMSVRLWSVTDC